MGQSLGDIASSAWDATADFVGEHKGDLAVGAASVAGFAVGGPVGAALAGGAMSAGVTALEGGDLGDIATSAVTDGALGMLGGGLGAAMTKGIFGKGIIKKLNGDLAGTLAASGRTYDLIGRRMGRGAGTVQGIRRWFRTQNGAFGNYTAGMVGSYVGGAFGREMLGYEFGGDDGGAGTTLAEIPTIPISGKDDPANMPSVEMPDKDDARWPADLTFTLQDAYMTLPDMYADTRRNFGKDPSEADYPDEDPLLVYIDGVEEAGVDNYPELVKDLETKFENIKKTGAEVSEAVDRTTELCRRGIADVDIAIGLLNTFASIHPKDGTNIELAVGTTEGSAIPQFVFPTTYVGGGDYTENNYVVSMIAGVYGGVESIMNAYSQLFAEAAAGVESPEVSESQQPSSFTPSMPAAPSMPSAPTAPNAPGSPNLDPSGIQPPRPLDLDGTDSSSASGLDDPASQADQAAREQLEQLGRDAAAADQLGQMGATAGMAGTPGSGMESMMLPMMMQAMMGGLGNQQQGLGGDGPQLRHRQGNQPVAPPPAAPAPAAPRTTPAAAAPATTQPPPGRVSAPVANQGAGTAGKPANTPEGNVVYTFPDGRTQEVSAVVAQALDAAFDNPAATDAKAAYAKTPKQWTDEKDVGARVDPSHLMTGDVGYWEDRSALLIVFGADADGTLEAVVDGELQPMVSPEDMRDGRGDFGPFIGFFHPPGIEKAADDSAVSAGSAEAPPPDQSVAVAPV